MNSYLVTLKTGYTIDDARIMCWEHDIKIEESLPISGIIVVRCPVEKAHQIGVWECVESVEVERQHNASGGKPIDKT